jgi:hypothetical protein
MLVSLAKAGRFVTSTRRTIPKLYTSVLPLSSPNLKYLHMLTQWIYRRKLLLIICVSSNVLAARVGRKLNWGHTQDPCTHWCQPVCQ